MNHIREKLPDMKAKLNTLMGQAEQELASFGDASFFVDKNQVNCALPQLVLVLIDFPAKLAHFAPHDSIRTRLYRVHREHQSSYLYERALGWCADLLRVLRCVWPGAQRARPYDAFLSFT